MYAKDIPLSEVNRRTQVRRKKQLIAREQNRDALRQLHEAGYHYNRLAAQTSIKPVQARA